MAFTGLQSESRTSIVVAVLEDEFANPFDIALDRTMLTTLVQDQKWKHNAKPATRWHYSSKQVSSRMTSIILQSFLIQFLET